MERAFFHSLLECRQIPEEDPKSKGLQVDRECLGDFGVDCVDSFNERGADIISLFAGTAIFVPPCRVFRIAIAHLFKYARLEKFLVHLTGIKQPKHEGDVPTVVSTAS